MKKDFTINVNAPIEKVFSVVDNKDSKSQGVDSKITPYGYEDSERKEGLKYHLSIGTLHFEGEIIAYKRPRLFGVGLRHSLLSGTFFYRLEATNDHTTKLDCELEIYEGSKIRREITKISIPVLYKIAENHLKNIKEVAEK